MVIRGAATLPLPIRLRPGRALSVVAFDLGDNRRVGTARYGNHFDRQAVERRQRRVGNPDLVDRSQRQRQYLFVYPGQPAGRLVARHLGSLYAEQFGLHGDFTMSDCVWTESKPFTCTRCGWTYPLDGPPPRRNCGPTMPIDEQIDRLVGMALDTGRARASPERIAAKLALCRRPCPFRRAMRCTKCNCREVSWFDSLVESADPLGLWACEFWLSGGGGK